MRGVSIIIPIIRPEKAERCIAAVHKNIGIEDYEIVSKEDTERIGCPKMIKQLVELTKYNLIMFLGDDTIPQPGFMKNAVKAMNSLPDGWGLVGLNDGHYRQDECATHWLADKRLLPLLDGEFFHTGYIHTCCDNELTRRCKALGKYVWASDAKIKHDHPIFKGEELTGDYKRVYSEEATKHDQKLFVERNINHTFILNSLIEKHGLKRYLEIGVGNPAANFDFIKAEFKIGVDPNVDCDYRITSDEFFRLWTQNKGCPKFDLIFIDGLHAADQVLKDVENAEKVLNPNGYIVLHDCNPKSEYLQRPVEEFDGTGLWCGDVWKAYAKLRATRSDLEMWVFDVDYGVGVIRKGSQRLYSKPIEYSYQFLEENRHGLLNLRTPIGNANVGTKRAVVLAGTALGRDKRINVNTAMFLQSALSPNTKHGWKWTVRVGYGAEHSRNEMILECLKGNYTHLFFVDADTVPPDDTIERLLAHDKDIIAGATPVFVGEARWNYQIEKSVPVKIATPRQDLFTVARTGGTTILFKRHVLERVVKELKLPYYEVIRLDDPEDIQHGYLTDDYNFCDKLCAMGFKIWIDPTIVCGHVIPMDLINVLFKD